jgi:hypothetical protein
VLLRQFAIAALIVAGLSAALLFNEFHAYSSDTGQHYALVRALMDLDNWGSPSATPNLGSAFLSAQCRIGLQQRLVRSLDLAYSE